MRLPESLLKPNLKSACVVAGVAAIAAGLALAPRAAKTAPAQSAPAPFQKIASSQPLPALCLDVAQAVQNGDIQADFKSNGREQMQATLRNTTKRTIELHLRAGQLFENGKNSIVATRAAESTLRPGETTSATFATAATSAQNRVIDADYTPATGVFPNLAPLFAYLREHPEVSPAATQTAVLALTENLPLRAFAKFTVAGGDLPSKLDTSAFKVETVDIVAALSALREIGIPDEQLAVTIDPQLKIEAMIDPLALAFAMHYYGISNDDEWAFWKKELTGGNPSTRHYALYGIARFFPDVALEMMPSWVRETRTHPAFRVSAVQALAETQRPEALTILRQLEGELDPASEVGRAIKVAASYLDARLAKSAASKVAVAFRVSQL